MESHYNLERFISAQRSTYVDALNEMKAGKKRTHWMWYIFPQIAGLGYSEASVFYALKDTGEANAYLQHNVLGSRLIEISTALLKIDGKTANQIFGSPDDLKLRSCMTQFATLNKTDPIFKAVLAKFFNGATDDRTLAILRS